MLISLVVAKGNQNQIGKDNKLLWKVKDDLQNFKKITSGHHILMGRKTFESIGKPLPNRTTLIISSNKNYPPIENCIVFDDCFRAIEYAKNNGEKELMVCGGASIYDFFIENNLVDKIYLTTINYNSEADRFFPEINSENWEVVNEKSFDKNEINEYSGKIEELVKIEKKMTLADDNFITYKSIKNDPTSNLDLVYFHGFYSSIDSKKCKFFENFCRENKINFTALNYLGHGNSSGNVEDFTVSDWLKNIELVIDKCCHKNLVFLGSSMGSWLSLLTAIKYKNRVKGVVAMSSAIDFLTESVAPYVKNFNDDIILKIPNKEGEFVNVITKKLWDDGIKYTLLSNEKIDLNCPIRFIHGMQDILIDYKIILKFMEKVESNDVKLTLLKDANHYMSRDLDLKNIVDNLKELLNII